MIENLIRSLETTSARLWNNLEFIVYDNFYSKEEALYIKKLERNFPYLKVINGNENIGFAKANNLAASQSTNKYVFFVNPDCLLNEELVLEMKNLIEQNNDNAYFFPIIDQAGKSVRYAFRYPFLSHYLKKSDWRWFTGANLFIPKVFFENVGKWPEDYFMYSEDTDLHYNILLKNKRVFIGKATIIHIGNASVSTIWNTLERERRVFKSMYKFAKKYNKKIDFLTYYTIVSLSFLLKKPSYCLLRIKAMISGLTK